MQTEPEARQKVNRSLIVVLGFVGFVTSFGAHVVAVNLPVYAKQVGVGVALIGVLIAVYDFAEIFAKPVFGWIADRRGLKATMLADCVFFAGVVGVPRRSSATAHLDPVFSRLGCRSALDYLGCLGG